jgi:SAM-dependent methyltransferase
LGVGLDFHNIVLLASDTKSQGLGKVATLGRMMFFGDHGALRKFFGSAFDEYGYGSFCEPILQHYFGATRVDSFDASDYEGATFCHDFNMPLPRSFDYDTVLDFGTSEHIFNIAQALENVVRLCRVGGRIYHCLPADNWNGHGFWQFSPEVFFSFYSQERGFADTEVYLAEFRDRAVFYRVRQPPTDGKRLEIQSRSPTYILVRTTRTSEAQGGVQQSDYARAWARGVSALAETYGSTKPVAVTTGASLQPAQRLVYDPTAVRWFTKLIRTLPTFERRLRSWKDSLDYGVHLLVNRTYFFKDDQRFERVPIDKLLV